MSERNPHWTERVVDVNSLQQIAASFIGISCEVIVAADRKPGQLQEGGEWNLVVVAAKSRHQAAVMHSRPVWDLPRQDDGPDKRGCWCRAVRPGKQYATAGRPHRTRPRPRVWFNLSAFGGGSERGARSSMSVLLGQSSHSRTKAYQRTPRPRRLTLSSQHRRP